MTTLPSTTSLQCLVALNQLGTLALAAQHLNLSQSAASRQLKNLEETVQIKLFTLHGRRLTFTPRGQQFVDAITPAVSAIEHAVNNVRLVNGGQRLIRLAAPPTLGAIKLIPQLSALREIRPDIIVGLDSHIGAVNFEHDPYDMAIFRTASAPDGCAVYRYLIERFIPVVHPDLAHEALTELPLLQLTSRPHLWTHYFKNSRKTLHFGARFSQYPMLIQGALTKLGAALLPEFAATAPLSSGALVAVDAPRVLEEKHYMLVMPKANVNLPAVQHIIQALCGDADSPHSIQR